MADAPAQSHPAVTRMRHQDGRPQLATRVESFRLAVDVAVLRRTCMKTYCFYTSLIIHSISQSINQSAKLYVSSVLLKRITMVLKIIFCKQSAAASTVHLTVTLLQNINYQNTDVKTFLCILGTVAAIRYV